jgi:hypothetical protein
MNRPPNQRTRDRGTGHREDPPHTWKQRNTTRHCKLQICYRQEKLELENLLSARIGLFSVSDGIRTLTLDFLEIGRVLGYSLDASDLPGPGFSSVEFVSRSFRVAMRQTLLVWKANTEHLSGCRCRNYQESGFLYSRMVEFSPA